MLWLAGRVLLLSIDKFGGLSVSEISGFVETSRWVAHHATLIRRSMASGHKPCWDHRRVD
jgi:hypothetical protein